MKFLAFIKNSESYREQPPPPAMMQAMGEFVERSRKAGTLVDTGGLLPSKDGIRIRVEGGKMRITDGPFSESKEIIGGWAILNAPTKEAAQKVAVEFVELHRKHWPEFEFECEVRPMFDPAIGGVK